MATIPPGNKTGSATAIIIDDDPLSRESLKDLLAKHAKNVEVKALCKNAEAGLAAIERWDPDIIFLDIVMPGMTGFEMLRQLPSLKSQVIFTTSYDKFAIQAIRFAALDYLLKPVEPELLIDAVNLALKKIHKPDQKPLDVLTESDITKTLDSLPIPTMDGFTMVKISDIIYCEADARITKLFLVNKKMEAATRNLGDFETMLAPYGFFRIHKSHLINLKHLKKYIKGEGGQVEMSDGTVLDVSRRAKGGLLESIGY
jgi:two-component system LytT family response regulator